MRWQAQLIKRENWNIPEFYNLLFARMFHYYSTKTRKSAKVHIKVCEFTLAARRKSGISFVIHLSKNTVDPKNPRFSILSMIPINESAFDIKFLCINSSPNCTMFWNLSSFIRYRCIYLCSLVKKSVRSIYCSSFGLKWLQFDPI